MPPEQFSLLFFGTSVLHTKLAHEAPLYPLHFLLRQVEGGRNCNSVKVCLLPNVSWLLVVARLFVRSSLIRVGGWPAAKRLLQRLARLAKAYTNVALARQRTAPQADVNTQLVTLA